MSPKFGGADALLKCAGTAEFTTDVTLPGMLQGGILRSAHPHARITRVDTAAARALPGVRAVLTGEDLPPTARGRGVIAEGTVQSIADVVAIVAADTREAAREALRAIRVDYAVLPSVLDIRSAIAPDARIVFPGRPARDLPPDRVGKYSNVGAYGRVTWGDVEAGFASADVIVEEEYDNPFVSQASLEPRAAVASVDAAGKVTVWSNTQTPFGLRWTLASLLGLPASQVALRSPYIGGGFGGKTPISLEPLAALLSQRTGRPVRVVNSRREEFYAAFPRPAVLVRIKTGATRDGMIVARQIEAFGDGGTTASGWVGRTALLGLGPYRIPNLLSEAYDIYTHNFPCGAFRAPGAPAAFFAGESNLDSVAKAIGMDPIEVRLKNAWRDGDRAHTGQAVEHAPMEECIRKARDLICWKDGPTGPNRGLGIATGRWQSGPGNSRVVLALNADGSIQMLTGAVEQGNGSALLGPPLIVASVLGVAPEQIEVVRSGTEGGMQDAGSGGSKVTANLGVATLRAARDLKRQLLDLAAAELKAPVERLVMDADAIVDPTTGARTTVGTLASATYGKGQLVGTGSCSTSAKPYDRVRSIGSIWGGIANPAYFAQAVEVEVDPDTGAVKVLRVATAQDVGYAISPTAIAGQIHGGVMQGIGQALYEEMVIKDGHVVNANLAQYGVPTIHEMTEHAIAIVESRKDEGLDGVKGVGEHPNCALPAAIANAVYAATGVRPLRLPLRGEDVLGV